MPIPDITASSITREQAMNDIIQSVALEQTSISGILNAEAAKIDKMSADPNVSKEDLLDINSSVEAMVEALTKMEIILHSKFNLASKYTNKELPQTTFTVTFGQDYSVLYDGAPIVSGGKVPENSVVKVTYTAVTAPTEGAVSINGVAATGAVDGVNKVFKADCTIKSNTTIAATVAS